MPAALRPAITRLMRGFLFLPSVLAGSGILLSALSLWLDRSGLLDGWFAVLSFYALDADSARDILSTIAGATITVVSLVYSLTLVVFALAAGNIGPRILETFADNRVNQTTIGVLGATFFFSMLTMALVGTDEAPRLSVAMALLLVTISFFWLIYFVHDVARRILIDNEIGRTQHNLRRSIETLLRKEQAEDNETTKRPDRAGLGWAIAAKRSGYIASVDHAALVRLAERHDRFIDLPSGPGDFVIEGGELARLDGAHDAGIEAAIHAAITLADTRTPEGDIRFNVHLSVEIALRALSPGINDSYTAIGAIDHLTASLALILQRGAPAALHCDRNDHPRLWLERLSLHDLLGSALHPLRGASCGNMLVTLRLIDAIGRMRAVLGTQHQRITLRHLMLIGWDARHAIANPADRRELAKALWAAYRAAPTKMGLA